MIYLYLKTHNVTGLKYLGMTKRDPVKYKGSGVRWVKHIKQHGYDVKTEILKICENYDQISEAGVYYSQLWDIVNSQEFANIVPEDGINSCGMTGKKQSADTKKKISNSLMGHSVSDKVRETSRQTLLGKPSWNSGKKNEYSIFTEEQRLKRSEQMRGENNHFYQKTHSEEFKRQHIERQKSKISCPHCDKIGAIRIMKRWHFDNCKEKDAN